MGGCISVRRVVSLVCTIFSSVGWFSAEMTVLSLKGYFVFVSAPVRYLWLLDYSMYFQLLKSVNLFLDGDL